MRILAVLSFIFALGVSSTGQAVEAYSEQDQKSFLDWCTGKQGASETVCSCTLNRLAQTLPATTLSQYLASQGNFSLSTAAVTTGALVTQTLLSCSK